MVWAAQCGNFSIFTWNQFWSFWNPQIALLNILAAPNFEFLVVSDSDSAILVFYSSSDLSHLVASAFACHKVSAHHQFANGTYFIASASVLKFSHQQKEWIFVENFKEHTPISVTRSTNEKLWFHEKKPMNILLLSTVW